MPSFEALNLSKQLQKGLQDLNFLEPTPIQNETFAVIKSGADLVGIAQTGTGKTLAYMLPILQELKYSAQLNPRILIIVPTRELVLQVVQHIEAVAKFMNVRVKGVYGGTNINTQKLDISEGMDIVVATPGRLYDLTLAKALQLKEVRKLVIDEVDVMLDLGFRFQLTNIIELLPQRRQNIMFSATMTDEINTFIDDFFINPKKISVAISGTPLKNIEQLCIAVPNFHTKVNLLKYVIRDKESHQKVLVFVSNKRSADRLFSLVESEFNREVGVIHSNKTQNFRIRSITDFDNGKTRVLISTDVMARGIDLEKITHVINFDTPIFPENYMHRIGRTGRATQAGKSVLFYTEKEVPFKEAIEKLMQYEIPENKIPDEVEISTQLIPDEMPKIEDYKDRNRNSKSFIPGKSVHEKKEKNRKTNQGGSYKRELAKKYKKPLTRGDKGANQRRKKK